MASLRSILVAGTAVLQLAFAPTDPFADQVVQVTAGPHSAFDPNLMLGQPQGFGSALGSFDIFSPGVGGSVVLRLTAVAKDGPGTDLIVYENPFFVHGGSSPTDTFIECLFVEVSSNGISFARFPTAYFGPVGPHLGPLGQMLGVPSGWYRGFAGLYTVSAGPILDVDPLDVVDGGGDAFDFADLANHPLVLQGEVQLDHIRYVRLVDVQGGSTVADNGAVIWDAGDASFSTAEIDAVCAPNNEWILGANGRPQVEMTLVNGFLSIELSDSDGLWDIKNRLTASWDGVPFSFYSLLPAFVVTELSFTRVVLVTGPMPVDFPNSLLKVGARDGLDQVGGDAISLP